MSKKDVDIYKLDDIPGVGPIGAEKLEEHSICSKYDVLVSNWIEIAEITGMERDKAAKAVTYCREILTKSGDIWDNEMNAYQLLQKRKTLDFITTGSKAIDEIIGGGIESRAITEFAGPFRSGKTQIAHSLAVTIASKKVNPPNRVLFIDTEDTTRPERMVEMAKARNLIKTEEETKELLARIIIQKASGAAHLIAIIENCSHLIRDLNIKIIILDSGTSPFRQTMADMGNTGRRFRLMNRMVHFLKALAEIHNIPVVFINQIYESLDQFKPGPIQYGGNVIGHAMTYRITLKKKSKVWVATTADFPHKPIEDAEFLITEAGIEDVKKKVKPKIES